jgi:hypothetical protein
MFAVAVKAYHEKLLTRDVYKRITLMITGNFQKAKSKNASGGNFYAIAAFNIGERFFKMMNQSIFEGATTYTQAFRLTNLNNKTFFELQKRMLEGNL